jgi:hypothetical protein
MLRPRLMPLQDFSMIFMAIARSQAAYGKSQ